MRFQETELAGAYLIELEPKHDERGYFARVFCEEEFAEHGLVRSFPQHSVSFNRIKATLRGLHFQTAPHEETRIVRCTRGRIYDVIVDLRSDSPTRCAWLGVELGADQPRQLYIPAGFAHGFQTLEDGCEVLYQMSTPYVPEASAGFHAESPALGIRWPLPVSCISERDASLPPLEK